MEGMAAAEAAHEEAVTAGVVAGGGGRDSQVGAAVGRGVAVAMKRGGATMATMASQVALGEAVAAITMPGVQ